MAHAFNPNTQEAETGGSLYFESWSAERLPEQSRLHRETLTWKKYPVWGVFSSALLPDGLRLWILSTWLRWILLTLATSEGTCREIPSSVTHKLHEPCFLIAFRGWWFVGKCLTPFTGRRKEENKCWKSDLWCLLASSVKIFTPWKTSHHQCSLTANRREEMSTITSTMWGEHTEVM